MEIKHNDIKIPSGNPFVNCKLDRKQYADVLTSIVNAYPEGFVMAVNSAWGTGKTTFVKMWQQSLTDDGYRTLYFNAWENDLLSDPTIAILGELKKLLNTKNEALFKKMLSYGAIFAKNILPALGKAILKPYIDTDEIADAAENAIKAVTTIFEKEVDEYTKKKKGIDDFKILLSEYVEAEKGDHPIVFIVDELDRCRPDYAVEVLEKIKHFFSVKGIVFVLSIDKEQLGNSVKGFYGSDCINAEEYLRRFIDVEYMLPIPNYGVFCNYMYGYFQFDTFFELMDRRMILQQEDEKGAFKFITLTLAKQHSLTLREIEKCFSHARLALNSFPINQYVHPTLFFLLIFLRSHKPSIYSNIKLKRYKIEELLKEISDIIEIPKERVGFNVTYIIAEVLVRYNGYLYLYEDMLLDKEGENLCFTTSIDNAELIRCIKSVRSNRGEGSLEKLIGKIELYNKVIL